jgi:hypothetical protein
VEEWIYSSSILNLGTRWRRVVIFTLLPPYPCERATGAHQIGGSVGSRASLEAVEKRIIVYFCLKSKPSSLAFQFVAHHYTKAYTEGFVLCIKR